MVQDHTINKINVLEILNKGRKCKACGLYLNQLPAYDSEKQGNIFWVGLSAVQFSQKEEQIPLSPLTRSGALISEIERPFKDQFAFYRTNVVKCLPLVNDRIRYPVTNEMEKCFPNLQDELDIFRPSLVFLLGKQVGDFVLKKISKKNLPLSDQFEYQSFFNDGINFVPIHHPSYILVYKRKYIQSYIKAIQSCFTMTTESVHY